MKSHLASWKNFFFFLIKSWFTSPGISTGNLGKIEDVICSYKRKYGRIPTVFYLISIRDWLNWTPYRKMVSFKRKNTHTNFFFLCSSSIRCFSGKSLGFWIRQSWVCILILPFVVLLVMRTWSNNLTSVSSFLTWRSCLMHKVIVRIQAVSVIPGTFMSPINFWSFASLGASVFTWSNTQFLSTFTYLLLTKLFKDWLITNQCF